MPFTASPTNAMEMNNAMTSSVDLGKNGNQQEPRVIIHVLSKRGSFSFCFAFVMFFPGVTIQRRLNNGADRERAHADKSLITFPSRKRKQTPRLLSASTSHRGRLHLFPAVPASVCVTNDVRRCRCVFLPFEEFHQQADIE